MTLNRLLKALVYDVEYNIRKQKSLPDFMQNYAHIYNNIHDIKKPNFLTLFIRVSNEYV